MNSRKGKQRNKCRKNIIGLKINIIKKRKEEMEEERKKIKKRKLHRTAKTQHRGNGL